MNNQSKFGIAVGIFLLLVVFSIATIHMFTGTSTEIFDAQLKNKELVAVIIIMSTSYGADTWIDIRKLVRMEISKHSNLNNVNKTTYKLLTNKHYNVEALSISLQVYKM